MFGYKEQSFAAVNYFLMVLHLFERCKRDPMLHSVPLRTRYPAVASRFICIKIIDCNVRKLR